MDRKWKIRLYIAFGVLFALVILGLNFIITLAANSVGQH